MSSAIATKAPKVSRSRVETAEAIVTGDGADLADLLLSADDHKLGYASVSEIDTMGKMFVHEITDHIAYIATHPELRDTVPMYMGPSGIGKTFAIRAGIKKAGQIMGREVIVEERHLSNMGPTDILGVPRPEIKFIDRQGNFVSALEQAREDVHTYETQRTVFYPPAYLPLISANPAHAIADSRYMDHWEKYGHSDFSIMKDFPLHVLFWDEVTNPSMPSVIHQIFSIIYGRQAAGHPLQPDTVNVIAGNRQQDGTNSIALPRSMTSRGDVIEVLPSLSGWFVNWALQTVSVATEWETDKKTGLIEVTAYEERPRVHPTVIAWLNRSPHSFAPNVQGTPTQQPFPAPRTWDAVSRAMYAQERPQNEALKMTDNTLFQTIVGHIGQSEAQLFWSFREQGHKLPNVRKLLNSADQPRSNDGDMVPYGWLPEKWPTEIDIQIQIGTQMAMNLNEANARRFMRFMLDTNYFSPEMAAMTMKMLRSMDDKINKVARHWARNEFTQFAMKYRAIMV